MHEMSDLQGEIERVRLEYRRVNQTRRALAVSFLKGTTSALGAIAAVVIVLPMIVWTLRTVEWPPLISGFITQILTQIEQTNPQVIQGAADQ